MPNSGSHWERNSWLAQCIPRARQQLQLPHIQLASNIQNRPDIACKTPMDQKEHKTSHFWAQKQTQGPPAADRTQEKRKEPLAFVSISGPSPSGSVHASSCERPSPSPSLGCQPLCRQREREEISNHDWCYTENKCNQARLRVHSHSDSKNDDSANIDGARAHCSLWELTRKEPWAEWVFIDKSSHAWWPLLYKHQIWSQVHRQQHRFKHNIIKTTHKEISRAAKETRHLFSSRD